MQCTCFDKLLKQEFCVSVCTVLMAREFTGMYQQVSILGNVEVYSFEQESQEIHKPVFIKLNEKKLELRCFSFFYLGAYFIFIIITQRSYITLLTSVGQAKRILYFKVQLEQAMAIYVFSARETQRFRKNIRWNDSLKSFSITNKIVNIEN